jgi:hypothetical protein
MPIAPQVISSAIYSQFSLNKLTGRDAIKLASAIGSSVSNYLMLPNMVTCSLNGTAGPMGNISSILVLGAIPTLMSGFMLSKATTMQLKGRDIKKLFDSISKGLSQVFMGMILSGTASGIAVGVGVGNFTSLNYQALSKLMYAAMIAKQLKGRDASILCDAISFGIVNHLKTSVRFTTVVTGVIAPVPPVGPIAVMGIPSIFTKIN